MKISNVTPENAAEESFYCIKNPKDPGFKSKQEWFNKRYEEGLRMKIIKEDKKLKSFIEYIPGEFAWRPINAKGYMFIHCVFTHLKNIKNKGYASLLIKECEEEAIEGGMHGVVVMTSEGTWMPDKRLFLKNGYIEVDQLDRFELMLKKFKEDIDNPSLINWNENLEKFQGWHLLYSDQCPYNSKAAEVIKKVAEEQRLNINVHKISSAEEARKMPSGFGTFNLVFKGKLLEDHYISERRFLNILNKELT